MPYLRARSETRIAGVYTIRHTASGRCYVGSSLDVGARLIAHARELRSGRHHAAPLQSIFDRDGRLADFTVECVVAAVGSPAALADAENEWIERLGGDGGQALLNGSTGAVTRYRKVRRVKRARLCVAAKEKQTARLARLWAGIIAAGAADSL